MGRDTRRELVIIPAQVKIREHVRYVYACRDCEKNACEVPVVKATVSGPVIKGSFASPEADCSYNDAKGRDGRAAVPSGAEMGTERHPAVAANHVPGAPAKS